MSGPPRLTLAATASIDLEAKADDGSPKRPTFAIDAYSGAPVNVSGFRHPVIVDLGGIKPYREQIPIFLDHNSSQIVGQTDHIEIDSSGIRLTGIVTSDDEPGRKVVGHAKNGFQWQASIGADVIRQEFLKPGESTRVNGYDVVGPKIIARESRLTETSFVAIGADAKAEAAIAAVGPQVSSQKGVPTMFEQWLEAKGFDPAAISDDQKAFFQGIYDAEVNAGKPAPAVRTAPKSGENPAASLDQIIEARRKEDKRVADITRITAEAINDRPIFMDEFEKMARSAIAAGSTIEQYELETLRLIRQLGPVSRVPVSAQFGGDVVEAAVCMGAGLESAILEKSYDAKVLNAAGKQFPRGIGLKSLLLMAARQNGYQGHDDSDIEEILKAAFGRATIRAEFSTISLPGTLSNVANKFLRDGFNAVEDSWRMISAIRSVRDFKTATTYSLTGGFMYDKVGPTGELKHATVGELSYTSKVDTYGKMFAISRQDIINDDLGALTEVPRKLGRGAALKLNDIFWTEFLANAGTFYTSARKNVSTGAGSALSSAGLTAANLAFRKQVDADGFPLALTPRILLVPPELEITANELMSGLVINTDGTFATLGATNRTWMNKYTVVVSSYLSNTNYTGNSTAAWYLLADPAELPVIEVAFLNGRQEPVVENADADFNTLGIQMRGYFDFGVGKQEYRAAVRSAGS